MGKDKFTVVGYDKDGDVYVPYNSFKKFDDAVKNAKELTEFVKKDELKRDNGEPIDWIQIYQDWGTNDETVIWGSYLEKEEAV